MSGNEAGMEAESNYYTPLEVMKYLDIDFDTLRALTHSHTLSAVRMEWGALRFRKDDVARYVDSPANHQYVAPKMAAMMLGVVYTTVVTWTKEGWFTPKKLPNGRRLYLREEIEAFASMMSDREELTSEEEVEVSVH